MMHPLLESALNLLFPQENVCHLCGRWPESGILCESCMKGLQARRLEHPSLHFRTGVLTVVSRWKHRSVPRNLVHLLKYHSDPQAAALLAEGMTAALVEEEEVLRQAKLIIPVPLHPLREQERGYNQAELLAREISRTTGLPMRTDLLCRTRQTGMLAQMTRDERLSAMRGAFAVASSKDVYGRSILLVDDVFTTGATAQACADALYQAGASAVRLVTACRA